MAPCLPLYCWHNLHGHLFLHHVAVTPQIIVFKHLSVHYKAHFMNQGHGMVFIAVWPVSTILRAFFLMRIWQGSPVAVVARGVVHFTDMKLLHEGISNFCEQSWSSSRRVYKVPVEWKDLEADFKSWWDPQMNKLSQCYLIWVAIWVHNSGFRERKLTVMERMKHLIRSIWFIR